MIVRQATSNDAHTIASFNQAMALETEDLHLPDQQIFDGVSNQIANPEHGYYLVVETPILEDATDIDSESRVIGCLGVTYEWSDWRNGQFLWIQSVYIAPNARRLGAFKAMYNHVLEQAQQAPNVCGVRLYVENDNDQARNTYLHLGMHKTHYDLLEIEV